MRKVLLFGTAIIMALSITSLSSCNSNSSDTTNIMMGTYSTEDRTGQVNLYDRNEYTVSIIHISRSISGIYSIAGNKLYLYDDNVEVVFSLDNNKIVFFGAFVNGKEEDWYMKIGTVFFYQEFYEIEIDNMVDCYSFSFEIARSSQGSPIILNYIDSKAIFECSVDNGLFYVQNAGNINKIEVEPGNGFWWMPSEESFNLNKEIFVDVILKLDNRIIGYAVIELYPSDTTKLNFLAKKLKSALFPSIDGKYQKITTVQVESIINKIKEGK